MDLGTVVRHTLRHTAPQVQKQPVWAAGAIHGAWTVDDGPGTRGVDTPASPFLGSHSQAPEAGGTQP